MVTVDEGVEYTIPWMSKQLQLSSFQAFNTCIAECKGLEIAAVGTAAYGLMPGKAPQTYDVACNKLLAWFNAARIFYQKKDNLESADRAIAYAYLLRIGHLKKLFDWLNDSKPLGLLKDESRSKMMKTAAKAMTPSEYPEFDLTNLKLLRSAISNL